MNPQPLPEGLARARPLVFRAMARGFKPTRKRNVAQWAAEERIVSAESGSPFPGKWSNDLTPHLVEPMECCTLSDPAREIVFKKCHQAGWSEAGLNLIGSIIVDDPAPIAVVLPTTDDMRTYVKTKLQPMIDATPSVLAKVREQKSRDEDGSTTMFKKFSGGYLRMTGAGSSRGLKMITARVVILEEVSEYPADVDGQGDPVELAKKRATTWEGYEKIIYISTPGHKGACRVSEKYELSDQRVLYLPCPHCGVFQFLKWERLDKEALEPAYTCLAHGCVVEHRSLRGMLRAAVWLKSYPGDEANPKPPDTIVPEDIERWRARPNGGRQPGFFFPALNSPLMSWAAIVKQWREARGDNAKEQDFVRQVLAEAWEDKGEAPDHERLFEKRALYDWRRIPKGALFLTGGVDVQGNRLEWAVYAWGMEFSSWIIDKGVIEGDPSENETWKRLDEVLEHGWADEAGQLWKLDALGVDTGYLSHDVYRWVRQHASTGKVFALDGRKGWRIPSLGTPQKKDIDFQGKKIGQILLWPVGNWGLKSELYAGLRKMIRGRNEITGEFLPGSALYGEACDLAYLEQLTAEHLITRVGRNGLAEQVWEVMTGRRNEAHDIAVYARALAHHLGDGMRPEDWTALAVRRNAAVSSSAAPAVNPPTEERTERARDDDWLGSRANNWLRH